MPTQIINTLRMGNAPTAPLFKAGDAVVFIQNWQNGIWLEQNQVSVLPGQKGYIVNSTNINGWPGLDLFMNGNNNGGNNTGTQKSQFPADTFWGNFYSVKLTDGRILHNVPESVLSPTIIGNEVWQSIPLTTRYLLIAVLVYAAYKLLK